MAQPPVSASDHPALLFSPGPSNISERVRRALLHPDIGHREPEFGMLLDDVRRGIREVCAVPSEYEVILLGGSGSVGIESVVAAAGGIGPLLVIANGPYGERAAAMARHHGTTVDEWRLAWGAAIPLGELDARLAEKSYGAVYMVHHETATGRLNRIREISASAQRHGVQLLVDTISSIAGEEIDIGGWGLDAVIGSANKCLRGVPGAAFVIASPRFATAARTQRAVHYSSFALHAEAQQRGEFPFTPPLHAMFALREALAETRDEGPVTRIAHYRKLMAHLRAGLEELGLTPMIDAPNGGHTIAAMPLPEGWSYAKLHDALKSEGLVVYGAQGPLAATHFRIGLIGHFGAEAVEKLLAALRRLLGTE
jgi:2-aminoethylphosphonate-pyruvate transaminase